MTTGSPWQRPFAPESCDVLVVGGGIIGASTACALRRLQPELNIVLVDAGHLAWGASGRNAGFLIPGTHTDFASAAGEYGVDRARRVLEFTLENVALVSALDTSAFDLDPSGSLVAAGSPEEASRLERSARMLEEEGIASTFLEAPAVRERTGGGRFEGGLYLEAGGTLDPVKLVRHLARASRAEILERWPVEEIEPAGDGVMVRGPGGAIRAGRVVLCLNAFLPRLVPTAERWVRPVRAQMLATAPVRPFLNLPVYSHEGYFYLRQTRSGRLLLGGARHLHEAEEVGYEALPTSAVQQSLESYLRDHFPHLGEVGVERRWSGIMGFSPDGLPVAGPLPGVPGAHFACGFTGHGMGYGLRFGFVMARMALGETDAAADLFRADRF